jgi:hypothetical protein
MFYNIFRVTGRACRIFAHRFEHLPAVVAVILHKPARFHSNNWAAARAHFFPKSLVMFQVDKHSCVFLAREQIPARKKSHNWAYNMLRYYSNRRPALPT